MANESGWELTYAPRKWQREAFETWKQNDRGTVEVVTGGGKTVFALMCVEYFHRKHTDAMTIVIVPTRVLLDQWFVSLQDDLNVSPDSISCFSGDEKPPGPGIINIMVINTARELAPRLAASGKTFLIVDECHRAGSPANSKALRGQHIATLGLSATPEREYDEGFEARVAPILGHLIFQYDYVQARADGVITPFDLVNLRVPLLPDETMKYEGLTKQIAVRISKLGGHDHNDETLSRLLLARARVSATAAMRIPVAGKLVDMNSRRRTLVFHERVQAANVINQNLSKRGHSAAVYHSKISPEVRRDNLRLYRAGVFDVLVCCRALDEGLNVPETHIAIIASSTASRRQRIQRLGRVLRPAPGKQTSTIYTLYATDQEEQRLLQEEEKLIDVASVTWQTGSVNGAG